VAVPMRKTCAKYAWTQPRSAKRCTREDKSLYPG
jgi:hypothetical protein